MIYSYQKAPTTIPKRASMLTHASQQVAVPDGMIITNEALEYFVQKTHLEEEIEKLQGAITDEESRTRVDKEIKRLVVTAKIPQEVGAVLTEIVEVLGLHRTELTVQEVPLVTTLYTDATADKESSIVNISGKKKLADAFRRLYSRLFVSPFPDHGPQTSIVVYRMPPVESTVRVHFHENAWIVQAVHGWQAMHSAPEDGDVFIIDETGTQLLSKNISEQKQTLVRNPRTNEMVTTKDAKGTQQKITDQQAFEAVRTLRKAQLTAGVIGMNEKKQWLLRILPQITTSEAQPPLEEVPQAPPEVEVIDIETQKEEELVEEDTIIPDPIPEEEIESIPFEEPSVEEVVEEQKEEREVEKEIEQFTEHEEKREQQATRASEAARSEAQRASGLAISHAVSAITYALKESVGAEGPMQLPELVELVAQEREVPVKQRLLSLYEMRQSGEFDRPSPDVVRFTLETMNRFFDNF